MRSTTQRWRPRRSLLSTSRRAMRGTMPRLRQAPRQRGIVVSFVGVQLGRTLARPSRALPDRRHGLEQRLEEPAVVHVRGAEQERERDAAGIDDHVPLAAGLAAVGRVRADALAPSLAAKEALSSEQRPKSIAFARPSRSSSAWWSRSKTFAACQSRSLRQQVMPEPQPIALGRLAHGMPVRSTKTMPSRTLRSSRGWTATLRAWRSLREQGRDQRPERVGDEQFSHPPRLTRPAAPGRFCYALLPLASWSEPPAFPRLLPRALCAMDVMGWNGMTAAIDRK